MIKTIITPQNNSYNLTIPENYIGKKIEVLLYSIDEVVEEKTKPKKSMADFWGTISDETANDMRAELIKDRESWEERLKKQF